jgi:hypothetical protein
MRFLLDANPPDVHRLVAEHPSFVAGQLICPAHSRSNWGGAFAMDNSAYTKFDADAFLRLQRRNVDSRGRCVFATCPDVVGNMRRTLELFRHRDRFSAGFDLCLVVQNGAEDMDIPWAQTPALFVGGVDPWKESAACRDIIKTAKAFGLHVHCGRVNQIARFEYMADLGVDTCDGSGVSRFGFRQLLQIVRRTNGKQQQSMFDEPSGEGARAFDGAAVDLRNG